MGINEVFTNNTVRAIPKSNEDNYVISSQALHVEFLFILTNILERVVNIYEIK